jgi:hypothetical protein
MVVGMISFFLNAKNSYNEGNKSAVNGWICSFLLAASIMIDYLVKIL